MPEKKDKARPSAEVFNQYESQANGSDSEFDRESQNVQN